METTKNVVRVGAQLLRASARKLEQGGSWKESVDEMRALADELETIAKEPGVGGDTNAER
jgi:hypothetical protein